MDDRLSDSEETERLLEQLRAGDGGALNQLLERHRPYLSQFVELRLDSRIRARVDPSDVVQEAQLEAARRLRDDPRQPPMPFRLWLRQFASDRLLMLRRFHVGAARRSVRREVVLPDRSSLLLAEQFLAPGPAPARALRNSVRTSSVVTRVVDAFAAAQPQAAACHEAGRRWRTAA